MIIPEHQVIDLYRGKAKYIRVEHCIGCKKTIAMEVIDKIGQYGEEYWLLADAIKCKGEIEHYFARSEKWYDLLMQCPSCGRVGKLGMDKPLNLEHMQQKQEGYNARN